MEETGANVHGIIWELDKDHQVTLDKQEGVPTVYQRIEVQVSYHIVWKSSKMSHFLFSVDPKNSPMYHKVVWILR